MLLFLAWQICAAIEFIAVVVLSLVSIFKQQTDIATALENLWSALPTAGAVFLVTMAAVAIIYVIVAAICGGRYCVLYEMDSNMLVHRQLPSRIRKEAVTDALESLTVPTIRTPRQMNLQKRAFEDSIVSDFAFVRRIKGSRNRNLIVVCEPTVKNHVHVHPDDYATIMGYLRQRCPRARVTA